MLVVAGVLGGFLCGGMNFFPSFFWMPRPSRKLRTGPVHNVRKQRLEHMKLHVSIVAAQNYLHLAAVSRSLCHDIAPYNAFSRANPTLVERVHDSRGRQEKRISSAVRSLALAWNRLCAAREAAEEALRAVGAWNDAEQEEWFIPST
jgi:hypothetical protein